MCTYPSGREGDAECVRVSTAVQFPGGADVRAPCVIRGHRSCTQYAVTRVAIASRGLAGAPGRAEWARPTELGRGSPGQGRTFMLRC